MKPIFFKKKSKNGYPVKYLLIYEWNFESAPEYCTKQSNYLTRIPPLKDAIIYLVAQWLGS